MFKISHDSEKPANGQQVITACAFIHRQVDGIEKVFLPRRAATKKFLPNVYELPGGHIDYGEDIEAGLKREIEEEFNVHVNLGDPFAVFTYTNEIKDSHSIEVIYFAQLTDRPDAITLVPQDHSKAGWFAEDELGKVTTQNKGVDDVEFVAIKKGFSLLRGEQPSF